MHPFYLTTTAYPGQLHVDPVQPPPCRELRLQRFPREENHPQAVAKLSTPPRHPVRWRGWRGGRRRRNGERGAAARDFRHGFRKPPPTTPTTPLLYRLQVGLPTSGYGQPPTTAVRDQSRPGCTWRIWERSLARSNGHGPAARFGQLVAGRFLDFR